MTRDLERCAYCGSPYCPNDHERSDERSEHDMRDRAGDGGAAVLVVWAFLFWFALVLVGWIMGA